MSSQSSPSAHCTAVIYVITGALFLFGLGAWASTRASRELVTTGQVSRATFAAALLAFVGHAGATGSAALVHAWRMPIPSTAAAVVGSCLVMGGATLYIAGRLHFSFGLTWGLRSDRLVTKGIYRYTRNPQSLGWLIVNFGAAIAGYSAAALLLAAFLLAGFVAWLPVEERALEARFGEAYRRYCNQTARYFGRRGTP